MSCLVRRERGGEVRTIVEIERPMTGRGECSHREFDGIAHLSTNSSEDIHIPTYVLVTSSGFSNIKKTNNNAFSLKPSVWNPVKESK